MIKYALVKDRWLIDDLEDEFKATYGCMMHPITDDDIYWSDGGLGVAWVNPDNNGPIDHLSAYLLIRRTSEEVLFDGARYIKSTTRIKEHFSCTEDKEDEGIEIKSEWYLVEDIVDEQAVLDQKLKMMRV